MRTSLHGLPTQSHSIETEHRLTKLEVRQESHDQIEDRLEAISKRMALHEKAILGILGLLQVVLQDKYPALAAIIKSLTP